MTAVQSRAGRSGYRLMADGPGEIDYDTSVDLGAVMEGLKETGVAR
jgi:hypothetical protein